MQNVTSTSVASTASTIAALQAQLAALQAAQQQAVTASRTARLTAARGVVAKLQAALLQPPTLTDSGAVAAYVAIAPKLARAQAAMAKWGVAVAAQAPGKPTGRGGLAGGPAASVNPAAKCNGGPGVVKAYKGAGAGPLGTTPGSKAACAVQCVIDAGPAGASMRDMQAAVAAQFGACNDAYRNLCGALVKAGKLQVVPSSHPVRWAAV